MMFDALHISVSINRPAGEVYGFASNPANLPLWAAGLGGSIKNIHGEWIAESPQGTIKIEFAERNGFGVLDHVVTLPDGEAFHNPMRVIPNGDGCEIVFTLFRRSGVSGEEFTADAKTIKADFIKLKAILENRED